MKISSLFLLLSIFALSSCTPTMKPVENAKTTDNPKEIVKPKVETSKLAEGKNIFSASCAKCHDLPNPTDHSKEKWVGIMNSMAKEAKLTDVEHQMVYNYIISVK